MTAALTRTVGKTPAMAFVLDYLREFPGAGYHLVKKAALSHGLPAPAPVIYGNALRVIRVEGEKAVGPRRAGSPQIRTALCDLRSSAISHWRRTSSSRTGLLHWPSQSSTPAGIR